MRTTLTIDDDVLAAAKAIAERGKGLLGESSRNWQGGRFADGSGCNSQRYSLLPSKARGEARDAGNRQPAADELPLTYLFRASMFCIALIDPNHVAHHQAHECVTKGLTGQNDLEDLPIDGERSDPDHRSFQLIPNTLGSPAAGCRESWKPCAIYPVTRSGRTKSGLVLVQMMSIRTAY